MNIEELKARALKEIDIPGFFEGDEPIKIKVKKPAMTLLMTQGKIPNTLMETALKLTGKKITKPEDIKDVKDSDLEEIGKIIELFCFACMVEPTYEEFKDIMTDEQIAVIFEFAKGESEKLNPFRG